ncbi:MAG: ABC transporter ATP-binding protein/permease [Candidatus Cloacimonetes bacterium]|nr:ABC transporter ATP-binding protein/permease [Candidatus Cloacimonadota bacterium]
MPPLGGHGIYSDEIKTKLYDRRLLGSLLRYLKPYWAYALFSLILLLIVTTIELFIPLITMYAVDDYIVSDRSLLRFETTEAYDEFAQRYPRLDGLQTYADGDTTWIVLPTKKRSFISSQDRELWKDEGRFFDERFALVQNNAENRAILARVKTNPAYYTLSDETLAVRQEVIDVFTGSQQLTSSELGVLRHNDIMALVWLGLLFLAAVVGRFVFQFFQVYFINHAAQHAMYDLRCDLFLHMSKMPQQYFDRNPVGRLVTRVTNDIRALDEVLSAGLLQLVQDILTLAGIIVMMLILDTRMALVCFCIMPFVAIYMKVFKDKTRVIYREVRRKLAGLNSRLSEDISGFRIIQLFNQYRNKLGHFNSINSGYFEAGFKQIRLFAVFRPIIFSMRYIVVALIIWYGGGQILRGTITLGLLLAFMRYLDRFFDPINSISEKFNVLQGAMAGAERIFDLFETDTQDYRQSAQLECKLDGGIEFRNVWLSYLDNKEYALRDISFVVKPGEKIALVGHTGSGKTSIINLLGDLYAYQKGEILVDGKPLNDYALSDLRHDIGIVQQDVFLFSGTIHDNIALGDDSIDEARLEEVSRHVNVYDFIDSLPGRFEEPVMERGATFSVGQRQLIAFARVLAYDPAIFVLDEATSNIDTETEIKIQDALSKVMAGRTSIIIAHRLSTIKHVDRILVLHKGELVEQGSHDELIAQRGLYYDLYRLQFE